MRRPFFALALGIQTINAPLQCAHTPDPSLRREDTAGDALNSLADDALLRGDRVTARSALRYLLHKYPSSRHAGAAKEKLLELGDGAEAP